MPTYGDSRGIDVPGVIGRIGSLLGNAGVNIAGFRLGREKPALGQGRRR